MSGLRSSSSYSRDGPMISANMDTTQLKHHTHCAFSDSDWSTSSDQLGSFHTLNVLGLEQGIPV